MAKRIYVRRDDFKEDEVTKIIELGGKFDSKGYLIINKVKVKLEELDNFKFALEAEHNKEENNYKEGEDIDMENKTTDVVVQFNSSEVKALKSLGFTLKQNQLMFNNNIVNCETQIKIKRELVYLVKYVKVCNSFERGYEKFNNYSGFIWVNLIKQNSKETIRNINNIVRGVSMSQYKTISNDKLIKLKEAIMIAKISDDWKDRLIRSINL